MKAIRFFGWQEFALLGLAVAWFGGASAMRAAEPAGKEPEALADEGDELFAKLGAKYEMRLKIKAKDLPSSVPLTVAVWKLEPSFEGVKFIAATQAEINFPTNLTANGPKYKVDFDIKPLAASLVGTSVLVRISAATGDSGIATVAIVDASGNPLSAAPPASLTTQDSAPHIQVDLGPFAPVRTPIGVGRRK